MFNPFKRYHPIVKLSMKHMQKKLDLRKSRYPEANNKDNWLTVPLFELISHLGREKVEFKEVINVILEVYRKGEIPSQELIDHVCDEMADVQNLAAMISDRVGALRPSLDVTLNPFIEGCDHYVLFRRSDRNVICSKCGLQRPIDRFPDITQIVNDGKFDDYNEKLHEKIVDSNGGVIGVRYLGD